VRGDCPTQIACQQDCAQDRGGGNCVKKNSDQFDDSNERGQVRGKSEFNGCLADKWDIHQMKNRVEEQERDYERADGSSDQNPRHERALRL
jgi:hypothetical protein